DFVAITDDGSVIILDEQVEENDMSEKLDKEAFAAMAEEWANDNGFGEKPAKPNIIVRFIRQGDEKVEMTKRSYYLTGIGSAIVGGILTGIVAILINRS